MTSYVILSRLAPMSMNEPADLKKLAGRVSSRIKEECPNVKWVGSYATFGRFDVIDVIEANTQQEVEKVAMIIQSFGHASTETLQATSWKKFIANI